MNFFKFGVFLAIVLPVYFYIDTYVLPNLYIFDPEVLQQIVNDALASAPTDNTTALFVDINQRMRDVYGETVIPFNTEDWFFNNAGGAMGSMFINHASFSEYVIFFGTAVGTEGHTGVHPASDYFYILKGEQWTHVPGDPEPTIYKAGDMNLMPRGTVRQYSMPSTAWALEYARGWIPGMLPFGLADTLFSTLDFGTFGKTVWLTAKAMIENVLRGKF
ncbi:ERG2/sigma1 receptor-like protein [Lipomyces oligophaga]|uniref:ERG2/sigma1 receptor-like protein n=1 Tax=Lipomyces oligophaga TaxID=45792 RepID=UPI0034CDE39B